METEIQFIVECPICSERYSANEGRKPRRTGCCDNVLCESCVSRLCHEGQFRCPHCQARKQIGSALSLKVSRETLHFLDALCSLCAECPGSKCSHCMRKLCRFCVAAHKPEVEVDLARFAEEAVQLDERWEELGRCLGHLVSAAEQAAAGGQARLRRAADELRSEAERARGVLDRAERAHEMPRGLRGSGSGRHDQRRAAGRAELAAINGCHERLLQLLARARAKATPAAASTTGGNPGSNEEDQCDEFNDSWESLSGPESTVAVDGAVATNAWAPQCRGARVTQLLSLPLDRAVWSVLHRQDTHSQLLLVESRRVRFLNWNPAKPQEATAERSWSTERAVIRGAVSMPGRELLLTTWGLDGVMRVDSSGALISQTGGHGRELGKFRRPYGLAYDGKRRVYVCDTGNNRLQVLLYPMLQAVGAIGDGCLEEPKSVAIDGDRLLATHSGGVAVFSAKTSGLVATYLEGLSPGVPKYGSFISVHPVSKMVFVSCKADILAFSLEGYELRKQFAVTLPGRKVRSLAAHATESVLFAETKCAESKERRLVCLSLELLPREPRDQEEPGVSQAWSTIKNAVLKALKE